MEGIMSDIGERMSVDEVMAEARKFFELVAVNVDYDGLMCDCSDCGTPIETDPGVGLGIGIRRINGQRMLSHFMVGLMCIKCQDRLAEANESHEAIPQAPMIDEVVT